jgi:kinesin family protein 5
MMADAAVLLLFLPFPRSSSKTFTMFGGGGSDKERFKMRGVIPRAADELFSGIADSEDLDEVTIKCSFLEIYKENIRDLLQPKNVGLKIREMPSGEVYVQGLSDEYVASSDDIMAILSAGEKQRSTASTDMNEVSSRSHSVLIIVVNQKLKDGSVRVGKLNLADLAGSERIERTHATGETLEEAKKINQSLSALGNCINSLTDSKRTHTPFRDSTLTFLLKDSLGGNTKVSAGEMDTS